MTMSFLVHSHIPKTGGSALNQRFLFPRHGTDRVQMLYRYVFETAHRLPRRHVTPSMRCHAATGHVPYGYFDRVYPDAVYVSVFREPVQRMLSFLNFVLATPGHKVQERIGPDMADRAPEDPDAFVMAVLAEPRLAVVHANVQVRLASGCARLGEAPVDALHFEVAETNLGRPGYVIGDQAAFPRFIAELSERFPRVAATRASSPPDARLEKRLPKVLHRDMFAPGTIAALEQANRWDLALYDRVTRQSQNRAAA